jgi:hypothetical protein
MHKKPSFIVHVDLDMSENPSIYDMLLAIFQLRAWLRDAHNGGLPKFGVYQYRIFFKRVVPKNRKTLLIL